MRGLVARRLAALVVAGSALGVGVPGAVAAPWPHRATSAATFAQVDDGQLPVPAEEPGEVRARADEILRAPEFRPRQRSLIDRVLEWIGRQIGEVLSRGAATGGGLIGWVLLMALVGGAVFLVRRIQAVPRVERDNGADEPSVLVVEGRSAAAWRAAAAAHEAREEWLDALRCHYQALVAELVERAVVEAVPGRTVGEYRDEVARVRPDASDAFVEATTVYEDAWYGTGDAGPDDTQRFSAGATRVLEAAAR